MGRILRTVAMGVLAACLLGTSAGAQILPPPPALPPVAVPDALGPLIAVASPTAGPVCGTASLLSLLAPSLVEGFLDIPLSSLVDSETFRSYANTALYVCGFVPFPLTPAQCDADRKIVDALRGLNPLAAQVVGLFPQGATVDTVLALEQLLPTGPSVAGPLADELSALMLCTRSSGAPPTPEASEPTDQAPPDIPVQLPAPAPAPAGPAVDPARVQLPSVPAGGETRPAEMSLPEVFETRLVERSGVQWLGIVVGLLLLAGSGAGWVVGRRPQPDQPG